ncbi:MAG TPA: EamA family transporter RarD [Candidatus Limnocylindrales bacterium]|nr:EamA family transporter RarD [Candidatus Limnocylindrales bacterium]
MADSRTNAGFWYAAGAYTSWGLLPIYWKMLAHVPAAQVICHRIVWSFALLAAVLALAGRWRAFADAATSWRSLGLYAAAAILIGINWTLFIWAVGAGFLVETSLGYYINPLISVLLGVVVLRERLRPMQWVPIALAGTGVAYLTLMHGSVPWVALLLATSFALYGLVKKTAPLASLDGLTLETGLLLVPAVSFLVYSEARGQGPLLGGDAVASAMLVGAGAITTAPLLMFASAAQRIPLFWVGILQYIAPTLQLALGTLVYGEPFHREQLIGFTLVWTALLVFIVEGLAARRAPVVVAEAE